MGYSTTLESRQRFARWTFSDKARSAVIAIAILLFAYALVVFTKDVVKPLLVPKRFGEVIDGQFYRMGRVHPTHLSNILIGREIDTIVTFTSVMPGDYFQAAEKQIAEENGIDLIRMPLRGDGTGNPDVYLEALSRIHSDLSQGKKVLVHCAAGTQRTGGIVFLYQTIYQNLSVHTALNELLAYDFDPERNPALLPFLAMVIPQVEAQASGTTSTDIHPIQRELVSLTSQHW